MIIHILLISHRHGSDVSLHRSGADLTDSLVDYVEGWWETELGERPMPDDPDEKVAAYFDAMDDESFEDFVIDVPWAVPAEIEP